MFSLDERPPLSQFIENRMAPVDSGPDRDPELHTHGLHVPDHRARIRPVAYPAPVEVI